LDDGLPFLSFYWFCLSFLFDLTRVRSGLLLFRIENLWWLVVAGSVSLQMGCNNKYSAFKFGLGFRNEKVLYRLDWSWAKKDAFIALSISLIN
jgi:hypothetical protein